MNIKSFVMTVASLFTPARSNHVSLGKIAMIGMLFTTFFLFTAAYNFPGGASHYPNWAEAIVNGTKLPPSVAQREVGFPLLYILGGFTVTHSFIGITLIFALFAMLMSVLVYVCLVGVSPVVAFYTALACIFTLSPFTYIKFFYPDEAYMFFNLLAATFLIVFVRSKGSYRWLYFFTLTAIAASYTRTAGNMMFPMLLVLGYLMARGKVRHYVICALIFALGTAVYQWHRYDIFDMRNQPSIPSGKGMQTIYPNYLYLRDFGLRLSPEFGPNTKRMLEQLHEQLQPDVRHSLLIQRSLSETPAAFMEKNVYAYTPDELVEKIASEPNEEFYNVLLAVDENDQFLLAVAKEIMKSNPWYVVQYTMRNMRHALFSPGYASTRYNTLGYGHTGNDFMPAVVGYGTRSEDPVSQYGVRAEKEMQYVPLTSAPRFIQRYFHKMQTAYLLHFDKYLFITNVLMIVVWSAAFLIGAAYIFSREKLLQAMNQLEFGSIIAPLIIASALLLYEDLLTSVFCQPVYRYFHLTEPLRLVVAGLGVYVTMKMISRWTAWSDSSGIQHIKGAVNGIQDHDYLEKYFSTRQRGWMFFLIALNIVLFGWWVISMLGHTQ